MKPARKSEACAWVRIASSAQAWALDPLAAKESLGTGCAEPRAMTPQRKRGDVGSVCFRSIRLTPETARWKRRVPRLRTDRMSCGSPFYRFQRLGSEPIEIQRAQPDHRSELFDRISPPGVPQID